MHYGNVGGTNAGALFYIGVNSFRKPKKISENFKNPAKFHEIEISFHIPTKMRSEIYILSGLATWN
jgi:hypothetical protein